ncbi:DNA replication licensing factor Mcm6-like, partial [Diaphorina citri]|uniref:DNA replication licensing factor MCM6 n=1 Tax=Diaphorina citri TaxID=121845 RepID=A0A1S3DMG0_DIACI
MDATGDIPSGRAVVRDEIGFQCQTLFQDFLSEFKEDGEIKYLEGAKELNLMERYTLEVSFEDVEKYNQNLATTIIEEYYRLYPFLCKAVANYAVEVSNAKSDKEYYVSFVDVPTRHKVRELTTTKIGTLIRISGQVVRTHPVHPELVSGVFQCLDCQTIVKDVEQQFKVQGRREINIWKGPRVEFDENGTHWKLYPFLCKAVANYAVEVSNAKSDKEYYVSFVDVPTRHKVRELTTTKIGTLIRISGQVVRTHPVHPELVSGVFQCLDCQTIVKDVEQQFK